VAFVAERVVRWRVVFAVSARPRPLRAEGRHGDPNGGARGGNGRLDRSRACVQTRPCCRMTRMTGTIERRRSEASFEGTVRSLSRASLAVSLLRRTSRSFRFLNCREGLRVRAGCASGIKKKSDPGRPLSTGRVAPQDACLRGGRNPPRPRSLRPGPKQTHLGEPIIYLSNVLGWFGDPGPTGTKFRPAWATTTRAQRLAAVDRWAIRSVQDGVVLGEPERGHDRGRREVHKGIKADRSPSVAT
jgi:hypothetical protein